MQEGQIKTIPVKGIERVGSYATQGEEGACNEVIGLELKDGVLVPFEPIRTKADISGYDDVWVHKTSKQNNYIYRNGRVLTWQSEEEALAGKHNQKTLTTLPADCTRIDFLNNILCYCRKMHVFKKNNDTGELEYSSATSVEDMGLEMTVGTIGNGIAVLVDKYQSNGFTKDEDGSSADYNKEAFLNHTKKLDYKQRISDNFKILSAGVRKGEYINGACLMRYAIRLYDGSYVNISEPILCTSDPYKVITRDGEIDYTDEGNSLLRARGADSFKFDTAGKVSPVFNTPVQEQLMKSAWWWEQLKYWEITDNGGDELKGKKCADLAKEAINFLKTIYKNIRDKELYEQPQWVNLLAGANSVNILKNQGFAARYQLPDYDYWELSVNKVGFREIYQFNNKDFYVDGYYKYDTSNKTLTYDYQQRTGGWKRHTENIADFNYYPINTNDKIYFVNAAQDITWDSYSAQVPPLREAPANTKKAKSALSSGYYWFVYNMICNPYQRWLPHDISDNMGTEVDFGVNADYTTSLASYFTGTSAALGAAALGTTTAALAASPLALGLTAPFLGLLFPFLLTGTIVLPDASKGTLTDFYGKTTNNLNNANWCNRYSNTSSNKHYGELGVALWNINQIDGDKNNNNANIYTVLSRELDTPAFILHSIHKDTLELVQSVDIFITEIVDCHEDYTDDDITTMAAHRPYRKRDEVIKELAGYAGTYYKIHSISKGELEKLELNQLVIPYIERGKISALEQQERLTEYGQDQYDYKVSYVYNSKLHIADITQVITHGFEHYAGGLGAHSMCEQSEGNNLATHHNHDRYDYLASLLNTNRDKINIAVKEKLGLTQGIIGDINDGSNDYTLVGSVRVEDDTINFNETLGWKKPIAFNNRLVLQSFIYPSAYATNAIIKGIEVRSNNKYYWFEINKGLSLTQDKTTNMSYYMGDPIDLNDFDHYSVTREASQGAAYADLKVDEEVTIERDGNTFKVSKLNNPIVFPYETTYTVGYGKIIGFSANTVALSQGQFGTYPLYVFTTEGIFTMQVDTSGVGSYLSSAPASREVCNNADTITQTDKGIYFSTEKGLMLLSGADTELMSGDINGTPEPLPNLSSEYAKGDGLKVYGNAITHVQLVQLSGAISKEDFRIYLSTAGTHVSYCYVKSKLIIYNKDFAYCYMLDIESNVCTKLNKRIAFDTKNYPASLYAIIDGYSMHKEQVIEDEVKMQLTK